MATIKPIEGRSVHQIQSGQVIVDLLSVVKELVENSLDAGATAIDVRFKAQGLEAIEVQDNGNGVPKEDYEAIGLKHYTSKLSTYEDLTSLNTFGFRGEAISSLCALSQLHITTARDGEAPKGTRLEFETSGKLKGTTVAACPKGTTVSIENLFQSLPVRRRELEKNIKREYGKVVGVLNAYACISTGVKFTVSNQPTKGKKVAVFATRNNPTTKENIANVYGAKTIAALIPLKLKLQMQPTATGPALTAAHSQSSQFEIEGHMSKPAHGEGRQTPDRQMFFVNSRPCMLPQVAKVFNEVYKSYNVTQSPFVFANLKLDTNAYDVNVSPDKRSILLHDQARLLETLREELIGLLEAQEQTVPQSQIPTSRLPSFKPLIVNRGIMANWEPSPHDTTAQSASEAAMQMSSLASSSVETSSTSDSQAVPRVNLIEKFVGRNVEERKTPKQGGLLTDEVPPKSKQAVARRLSERSRSESETPLDNGETISEHESDVDAERGPADAQRPAKSIIVQDFNNRLASQRAKRSPINQDQEMVRPANDSVEDPLQPMSKRRRVEEPKGTTSKPLQAQSSQFASSLQAFAAPGALLPSAHESDEGSDEDEAEDVEAKSSEDDMDGLDDKNRAHSPSTSSEDEIDDQFSSRSSPNQKGSDGDEEYIDEKSKKEQEDARVQQMVRDAEAAAAHPTLMNQKRANQILRQSAESTVNTKMRLTISTTDIKRQANRLEKFRTQDSSQGNDRFADPMPSSVSAEERLSLTVSKADFARMRIAGQFNLGFILAVRSSREDEEVEAKNTLREKNTKATDDLFIIDQHASDEIYNFHRLSASTQLVPQPLVHPHQLDLTAIEEETVIEHKDHSLAKNGFKIDVDLSGEQPVGQRCRLLTLPTSRETVFDLKDLEELLVLLADVPAPDTHGGRQSDSTGSARNVVRPGKVRRMLAMRACRSSIMVGRTLTAKGMHKVVRHMGEIDRPWNCPHGRPTMRHLFGLDKWHGWNETDSAPGGRVLSRHDDDDGQDEQEEMDTGPDMGDWERSGPTDWLGYLRRMGGVGGMAGEEDDEEEDM